ncbi:MAG: PAS domain S-box protein [Planctomycetota bacterium]
MFSWKVYSGLCAVLVMVLGLTTLAGWIWKLPLLLHWSPTSTPIVANMGVCFVGYGLGILLQPWRRGVPTILLGLLIFAFSTSTLAEYLFDVDLGIDRLLLEPYLVVGAPHAGRISPTSATALLFSSVALVASSWPSQAWSWRVHLRGLCGIIVFCMGVYGLVREFGGYASAFRWYPWTSIPTLDAVGLILMGLSLNSEFLASRGGWPVRGTSGVPPFLPSFAACAFLVLATMVLRQRLVERERAFVEQSTNSTARTLASWVEDVSDHTARALFRMANNWGNQASDIPRPRISIEGKSYLDEFPFLQAIALLDGSGNFIWSSSKDGEKPDWTRSFEESSAVRSMRDKAFREREPFLTVHDVNGTRQIVAIVPVLPERGKPIRGFVLGVIRPAAFLDELARDVVPGYGFRVSVNNHLVHETKEVSGLPDEWWSEQVTVSSHDVDWKLSVRPGSELVAHTRGPLSTVILVLGSCIACLSGMTVALAENASLRVREIEAAQRLLENEIVSRKLVEDSLRVSEERYALAMSGSFDGLWDWNISKREYYFSDRWRDLLGMDPSQLRVPEIEGLNLVHPEDRERVIAAVRKHVSERVPFDVEARLRTASGVHRWFQARGEATWNTSGKATRMTGSIRDIDDQKRAEEQLRTLNRTLEERVAERAAAAEQRADELARSESELHQQTKILRSVLDGMSDAVLVADTNRKIILFNRAAEEIIGIRDTNIEPSEWSTRYGCREPDGVTPCASDDLPLARAIRGETVVGVDLLVRNSALDEDRWINCNAGPLADDEGGIWGGVVVFRDVTRHRLLEQELRHGEERLRLALAAARMGTWELDASHKIVEWAEHEVPVVGPKSGRFRGTILEAAKQVHADDRAQFIEALNFAEDNVPARVELHFRILRDTGHVHWIEAHGRAVNTGDNAVPRMIGTFVDITEQVVAQQALRLQSEIVANVAEGIALIRARDERIVYANSTFEEMHGYEPGELYNAPIHTILEDSIAMENRRNHQRLTLQFATGQMRSVRKDGRAIWCQVNVSGFEHSEHGDVLVGVFTDVTERKQASEQLERSLREKEVLLKEIHHRVKNNLQVVSSLLSLQAADLLDPAARQQLTDSQNRIRSMALIHESLYRSTDLAKIDFSRYARQLADEIFSSQAKQSTHVQILLDAESIELGIDAAIPCGLILNELVSNSLRHAFGEKNTGEIAVGFHRLSDGKLCLSVADDGKGLSRPFDEEETSSLGFRLIAGLSDQLGGTVAVDHERGLRVRVTFPEPRSVTMAS